MRFLAREFYISFLLGVLVIYRRDVSAERLTAFALGGPPVDQGFSTWLAESIDERCHNPLWYDGGVFTHTQTVALRFFEGIGDDEFFESLVSDMVRGKITTAQVVEEIIWRSAGWIFLLALGVCMLLVAIVWTCAVTKRVRRCWTRTTCGFCCKDRHRISPWDIGKVKLFAGGVLVCLVVGGLAVGGYLKLFFGTEFYRSYTTLACDADQSVKGLLFGPSLGAPMTENEKLWNGTSNVFAKLIEFKDHVDLNNSVVQETLTLFDSFDDSFDELNSTTHRETDLIVALMDDVRDKIKDQHLDHVCFSCEYSSLYEERADEIIRHLEEELRMTRLELGRLLINDSALEFASDVADSMGIHVASLSEAIVDNYDTKQSNSGNTDALFWGVSVSMLCTGGIASLFALHSGFIYSLFMSTRVLRNYPSRLHRNCFAFNFCFAGLFASYCLVLASLILLAMTNLSGGCYVTGTRLLEHGRWDIILPDFGKSEVFGISTVLDTCVTKGGSGDMVEAMGIREEFDELLQRMEVSEKELQQRREALQVYDTSQLGEVDEAFSNASWVVVAEYDNLTHPFFEEIPFTGIQLHDASFYCPAAEHSPAETHICEGEGAVTIRGLVWLNNLINEHATEADWCMESVAEEATAVGCDSSEERRKVISFTTSTLDADVQKERALIASADVATSQKWLNAVHLAIQKEKLRTNKVLDCDGIPCAANTYMPYVTMLNVSVSYFVNDVSPHVEDIGASLMEVVEHGLKLLDYVILNLTSEIIDFIKEFDEALQCAFIGFTTRRVTDDICDLAFPALTMYAIGLFVSAGLCIFLLPLSWMVYHYVRDTMEEKNLYDAEEYHIDDNRQHTISVESVENTG